MEMERFPRLSLAAAHGIAAPSVAGPRIPTYVPTCLPTEAYSASKVHPRMPYRAPFASKVADLHNFLTLT